MKKLLILMLACAVVAVSAGSCGSKSNIPAGNINNYGYLLVDGNDIYYTRVIMTDLSYFGNIYKYNTVNKTEMLVAETEVDYPNEMNAYMTLYNGDLYFLPYFLNDSIKESSPNIYKVKPDGRNTVPTPLFEYDVLDGVIVGSPISCTFMQIEGGLIYYYDDVEQILYSMKPDGTNRKIICSTQMQSISISGGTAYFTDYELLMSVSLKGGEIKYIFDFLELLKFKDSYKQGDEYEDAYEFGDEYEEEYGFYLQDIIADGNYIYYSDDEYSRIGRIKTNGTGNEYIYVVPEDSGEYISFFNLSGENIYIVAEDYGIEKDYAILAVNIKGGAPKVIVSDAENLADILPVSIWGNTIYFCGMPIFEIMDSDYIWFTVPKTGGRPSPFKPFNEYNEFYDEEEWDADDEEDAEEE